MPPPPISGPDPSQARSAAGALRAQPEDASFETDFEDLAARFSAQSGGGLSPELSANLALEIVLNELVEQACVATGATGAAIVLQRDGQMVCRASSGATAPDLGARLDTSSGLSGEAVRTRRTQRCDDVLTDPRVDVEACKRLGLRSVMVMPLVRRGELVGVFELFSSEPNVFTEQDESTLDALGGRALNNLERAAEQLEAHPAAPATQEAGEIPREGRKGRPDLALVPGLDAPPPRFDFVTGALGTAVLITALLLGIAVGRHFGIHKSTARARTVAHVAASQVSPEETNVSGHNTQPTTSVQTPDVVKKSVLPAVPPGGLVVSRDGKEIFRMAPGADQEGEQGSGVDRAALTEPDKTEAQTVVHLSPQAAEGSVLRRVEPKYPEQARAKQVQGAVVLDVQIAADGAVRNVEVVSGAPLLAQASADAVKQWKFRTRRVNGRPAEMQTRVTLNFRLPQAN
jgi:TonB family protein